MRHQFIYIIAAFMVLALATGAPVMAVAQDDTPQVQVNAEAIDDWIVRCNDGVDGANKGDTKRGRCEISQSLSQKETNDRVAEINIGYPDTNENAVGVVALPLGVLLQYGGQLQIDDGEPMKFQFRSCEPAGCFALIALDDELVQAMRRGNTAHVSFMLPNQKIVKLPFSLKGFTKALKEIS